MNRTLTSVDFYGFPWTSADFHGLPVNSKVIVHQLPNSSLPPWLNHYNQYVHFSCLYAQPPHYLSRLTYHEVMRSVVNRAIVTGDGKRHCICCLCPYTYILCDDHFWGNNFEVSGVGWGFDKERR